MAWTGHKKAYDTVPHLWIKKCLDLFKTLLVNRMERWRVMLCTRNLELGEVDIKRDTFQGDSLRCLF